MRDERNPSPDRGLGTGVIAGMGATALVAVLVIWAPWNGSHVADKSAPGTTVGSSTRPAAPVAQLLPRPAPLDNDKKEPL
jgi:hypothetical protein